MSRDILGCSHFQAPSSLTRKPSPPRIPLRRDPKSCADILKHVYASRPDAAPPIHRRPRLIVDAKFDANAPDALAVLDHRLQLDGIARRQAIFPARQERRIAALQSQWLREPRSRIFVN